VEAALKAIAAPRRRQILRLVRDDELSAGEIASHFDVTRPAVSQHLNVLKEAGLVSERRNGTRRLYRARPEGLADLKEFLTEFWDVRLDALKREVEKEEKKKHGRKPLRPCRSSGPSRSKQVRRRSGSSSSTLTRRFVGWPDLHVRSTARRPLPLRGHPGATPARGEFVELDAPNRLVFTWGWENEERTPPGSSTVEIELTPDGDGTSLHFVHTLSSVESAESHSHGWDHYLPRLEIAARRWRSR